MSKRLRVEVDWEDSRFIGPGWTSASARFRPVLMHTAGYLIRSDRRAVVIATGFGARGQIAGVSVIPRSAVRKVRRLRK